MRNPNFVITVFTVCCKGCSCETIFHVSKAFVTYTRKNSSPLLPCNLSTVCGPVVVAVSLRVLVLRISAIGFQTQGDHWLGPRLTAWAMGSWGRLGAFVFRSALVWVVLLVWGRGIVRAFLSSPGALALWIGLSYKGLRVENSGRQERKRDAIKEHRQE